MKLYTRKDLQKALKQEGLPADLKTLKPLMVNGGVAGINTGSFYTEDDIKKIVKEVKQSRK